MPLLQFSWHEESPPAYLPTKQVYGFCFDHRGKCLLLEEPGERYTLPGGKPEGAEIHQETLEREVFEEATVLIEDVAIFGYQLVLGDDTCNDGQPYAQVRAIARIAGFLFARPDPATGIAYRRLLHSLGTVEKLLGWGTIGSAQCHAARRHAQKRFPELNLE